MHFLLLYTDPGSGMMLLQVLLAFFAGIAFYFRKFLYKLLGKNDFSIGLPDVKETVPENSLSGQNEG